jgi:hypothetical protein
MSAGSRWIYWLGVLVRTTDFDDLTDFGIACRGLPDLALAHVADRGFPHAVIHKAAHEWRLSDKRRQSNSLIYPP